MRRVVGILLIIMMVFASVGGPAFAAKPAKEASFVIEETYAYDVATGGEQKVAVFTVKDNSGEPEVESAIGGTAKIERVEIRKKVKYNLLFTYGGQGVDLFVVLKAENAEGATANLTLTIEITGVPAQNEPPQNTAPPSIEGTAEVGEAVTAAFGEWTDDQTEPLELSGAWLITGQDPIVAMNGGILTLQSEWAGASLQLSVTATDAEGLSTEAKSESIVIAGTTPAPDEIDYVALGDSIATGTVVPGYIDAEVPYPVRFRNYIESVEAGATVTLHDFSEDGDQSGDLLYKVRNDSGMRTALEEAEVITVSIGGNNLMSAAKYSFLGVSYYDFDRIDEAKAEAGRAAFEADFPQLMAEMRVLNSDAQIIVMTIYNPFKRTLDAGNYDMVETYLDRGDEKGINEVILAASDSGATFEVADIHAAFDEGYADSKDQITYMYIEDKVWFFELRNPHPNDLGQSIITAVHENLYSPVMGQ